MPAEPRDPPLFEFEGGPGLHPMLASEEYTYPDSKSM